jgi:hypothetical protein
VRSPVSLMGGHEELLELHEDQQLARLVQPWDFRRGKDFEADIFAKFRSSVHHPSSSPFGVFHLLVIFRCFTFRLTEASVSLALHAALGGTPVGFHVTYLKDRHFRFSIASKSVGLAVRDLKRVITEHFDAYFHLWRDGGDDWIREWRKWQEEEASWHYVSNRKLKLKSKSRPIKRVSFARKIIQDSPIKKSAPQESLLRLGEFDFRLGDSSAAGSSSVQN